MKASTLVLIAAFAVFFGSPAGAADLASPQEIADCARKNVPEVTSLRNVELVTTYRTGISRSLEAEIYGYRATDGLRHVVARIVSPEDVAGNTILAVEGGEEEPPRVIMKAPSANGLEAKAIELFGEGRQTGVLDTVFSPEDLARYQGLEWGAGESEKLEDGEVDGRPSYVVQTSFEEDDPSGYGRMVNYVDKDTCITLQSLLYDRGRNSAPRKILHAVPAEIRKVDDVWIAHDVTMKDHNSGEETRLLVESMQTVVEIPDFRVDLPDVAAPPKIEPPKVDPKAIKPEPEF